MSRTAASTAIRAAGHGSVQARPEPRRILPFVQDDREMAGEHHRPRFTLLDEGDRDLHQLRDQLLSKVSDPLQDSAQRTAVTRVHAAWPSPGQRRRRPDRLDDSSGRRGAIWQAESGIQRSDTSGPLVRVQNAL